MVTTAQLIKRHLSGLKNGEIFCTRDLLGYGKRNTVDNLLYRLVKTGRVTRLARGVFCNGLYRPARLTTWHIIDAKMKAWGKVYWRSQTPSAKALPAQATASVTVYVASTSSSFLTVDGICCRLERRGQRKMKLGESAAGSLARGIWDNGKQHFASQNVDALLLPIIGQDLTELLCMFKLLPAWLNNRLHGLRSRRFGAALSEVCRLGKDSQYCQLEMKLRPRPAATLSGPESKT